MIDQFSKWCDDPFKLFIIIYYLDTYSLLFGRYSFFYFNLLSSVYCNATNSPTTQLKNKVLVRKLNCLVFTLWMLYCFVYNRSWFLSPNTGRCRANEQVYFVFFLEEVLHAEISCGHSNVFTRWIYDNKIHISSKIITSFHYLCYIKHMWCWIICLIDCWGSM